MLILSKQDIKNIFSMRDAVASVKQSFSIYSKGGSFVPLRVNIGVPKYSGQSLFMPAYVPELDSIGVKIVSIFPENAKRGMPSVQAQVLLLDGETGAVCCILDGTYVTQLRTGAAAGAATDLLSKKDSKVGALIGSGGQALCQLEAMLAVRDLDIVKVYSPNFDHAKAFAESAQKELQKFNTRITAVKNSDEAVFDADVITTVTTAKQPTFNGKMVKKGAHINGVGSYTREMIEMDEYIIRNADRIYVDSKEAVLAEAGEIIIPLEKGIITEDIIYGELGDVINGIKKGRENDSEITLFKTVGIAVQDVVTASSIYKKAIEIGVGKNI